MQLFQFHGNQLRMIEKDGNPWFVLKDVCDVLEIGNPSDVKTRLEDGVVLIEGIPDSLGRMQKATIINEDGLYDVILESRKPEAKAFRKWITSEVLPSIRKTGSYSVQPQYKLPTTHVEAVEAYLIELKRNEVLVTENLMLEQRVKEYEPKISYLDTILKSKDTVTVTQIAKDYGLTGYQLNKVLHEEKIQYKLNEQWLLYRDHQDKGYTKSTTWDVHHKDGTTSVKMNTQWTQKGRLFIHEILGKRGIVPFMDREIAEEA